MFLFILIFTEFDEPSHILRIFVSELKKNSRNIGQSKSVPQIPTNFRKSENYLVCSTKRKTNFNRNERSRERLNRRRREIKRNTEIFIAHTHKYLLSSKSTHFAHAYDYKLYFGFFIHCIACGTSENHLCTDLHLRSKQAYKRIS